MFGLAWGPFGEYYSETDEEEDGAEEMSEETEETDNMDEDMYGCDENGKNEYGEDC